MSTSSPEKDKKKTKRRRMETIIIIIIIIIIMISGYYKEAQWAFNMKGQGRQSIKNENWSPGTGKISNL